jgi:hypothetical protein
MIQIGDKVKSNSFQSEGFVVALFYADYFLQKFSFFADDGKKYKITEIKD